MQIILSVSSSMALEKEAFLTQAYIMLFILQEENIFLTVGLAVCKQTSFAFRGLPQLQRDTFLELSSGGGSHPQTDSGKIKPSSFQLHPMWNTPDHLVSLLSFP